MKKIVRLTETDLTRIVQRILSEQPARPVGPKAGQQPTIPGKKPAPTNPNTPTGQQPQKNASQQMVANMKQIGSQVQNIINQYKAMCEKVQNKEFCDADLTKFKAKTIDNVASLATLKQQMK